MLLLGGVGGDTGQYQTHVRLRLDMDINKALEEHYKTQPPTTGMVIHCVDGFSLTVAAGESFTSVPPTSVAPWHAVEVWGVSDAPEFITQYARLYGYFLSSHYDQVPLHLVEDLIDRHGGQASSLGRSSDIVKPELMRKKVSTW